MESTRMYAVQAHGSGGLKTLSYDIVPRPTPQPGEVLIRVHAAGVNPLDWKLRMGIVELWPPHSFPVILGFDVAGTVEMLGSGVTDFEIGDEVYASPELGGYAEYVAVTVKDVARKPQSLGFLEAAAMGIAAIAAWQSLIEAIHLQPGQTLLIHGAAGGVGTFAVQLAKWRGAHVIGTASARNHAYLHQLGANEVIDYTSIRFEEVVSGVDAVLDLVGGDTQQRSCQVLGPGGVLVSIVDAPPLQLDEAWRINFIKFDILQPYGPALIELAHLVDAGQIRPYVSAVFPLQQAGQAQRLSESLHTRGKIVLQVRA